MKHKPEVVVIALVLICSVTGNQLSDKLTPQIPESEKLLVAQKLQTLCRLKPQESVGVSIENAWVAGLQDSILNQILRDGESYEDKFVKRILTESIVNSAVSSCKGEKRGKFPKQDDEDGGGIAGTGDVAEGVQNILTNVFSGNLFGVIQSSVGIRSPEAVSTTVAEIFRTLLSNISQAQHTIGTGTGNALGAIGSGGGAAAAGTSTATDTD